MKTITFPLITSLTKKLTLALPLAMAFCVPSVLAQSFDTATLSGGAAMQSLGNTGSGGNTSYTTGSSPGTGTMSGNTTAKTYQQNGNGMMLNPTGYGGLAPIFGGGGYGWAPSPGLDINLNLPGFSANLNLGGPGSYSTLGSPISGMPGPSGDPGFEASGGDGVIGMGGGPGGISLSGPGGVSLSGPGGFSSIGPGGVSISGPGASLSVSPFNGGTADLNVGGVNIVAPNLGQDLSNVGSDIGSAFGF